MRTTPPVSNRRRRRLESIAVVTAMIVRRLVLGGATPPDGVVHPFAVAAYSCRATARRIGCASVVLAWLVTCSFGSFDIAGADEAPAAKREKMKPGARPANRLVKETSPYLLLHAHNPVDWYPWGEEALAKARAEKKLIFLSIGYSSCYWCHVMERESFMDEAIAAALNKNFVCIKVDREERPDIDHIYMTALQTMGRGGGWPLTMILTPEAKPIIGGTYFPPRDKDVEIPGSAAKQKMTGLATFVDLVQDAWRKNPQDLRDYADKVASAVRTALRQRGAAIAPVKADTASATVQQLSEQFDAKFGGFSYNEANPAPPEIPRAVEPGLPARRRPPPGGLRKPERCSRSRSTIWCAVAFETIWAAAFIAIAPIAIGACRTSKKCSTTMRSSLASMPPHGR